MIATRNPCETLLSFSSDQRSAPVNSYANFLVQIVESFLLFFNFAFLGRKLFIHSFGETNFSSQSKWTQNMIISRWNKHDKPSLRKAEVNIQYLASIFCDCLMMISVKRHINVIAFLLRSSWRSLTLTTAINFSPFRSSIGWQMMSFNYFFVVFTAEITSQGQTSSRLSLWLSATNSSLHDQKKHSTDQPFIQTRVERKLGKIVSAEYWFCTTRGWLSNWFYLFISRISIFSATIQRRVLIPPFPSPLLCPLSFTYKFFLLLYSRVIYGVSRLIHDVINEWRKEDWKGGLSMNLL